MDPTILGFIALAVGAIWKAFPFLQKWIPVKGVVADVPAAPTSEGTLGRLDALRYAELVLRYLEQNDLDEGQDALREVVAILFSTPDKE